jgi:hypothetical protein
MRRYLFQFHTWAMGFVVTFDGWPVPMAVKTYGTLQCEIHMRLRGAICPDFSPWAARWRYEN